MSTPTEHSGASSWRSSRSFIIATACLALFTETLLYGFPAPILPYMLEHRLHSDPSQTPNTTAALLSVNGFVTLICSPLLATILDKTANRRAPLLLSLVACLVGTLLVAFTPSFWALYLGRILQAIAGSAAWIVCVAMLTESAGDKGTGAMLGLSTSFITGGTVSGPVFGGILLDLAGYWVAWTVPLGMLTLDIIARLVMVQPNRGPSPSSAVAKDDAENVGETSPLLRSSSLTTEIESGAGVNSDTTARSRNFYAVILRNVGVWASILSTVVLASIRVGFSITLPVYLRDTFNWGPSSVGLVFFAIQAPAMFLSPIIGLIRDRVGIRVPTILGWALLCPLLACLGIPGSRVSSDSTSQKSSETMFALCVCSIGIVMPFLQGAGSLYILNASRKLEIEYPGIFGPNGGRSRAFALNSVSFNTGLMLGPLLTGFLFGGIGYYYMNIVLAAICLFVAVVTFFFY
ncbi:hypothetical protein FQN49_008716 [Arthroderma sp. PD_2]|nr:hypothetical protein FQN49_008716 [Arthroderma sp. PD_2]